MLWQKNLETRYTVDVFIAGGGPSGITAALAASRLGKSVFLAEASGMFGGAATAALVPSFACFGDGVQTLVQGIGLEIRKKAAPEVPLNYAWTAIDTERLKRVYDEMMIESGVKFLFFAEVCDVIVSNKRIQSVIVHTKSGFFAVTANVYIDCTGDGDLCALAGADFEQGDDDGEVMPPTLCSQWAGIDFEEIKELLPRLDDSCQSYPETNKDGLRQAISDGVFTYPDLHVPGIFRSVKEGSVEIGGGNVGHMFHTNPTDDTSLTSAMITGRKQVEEFGCYYKKYQKGYEHIRLVNTAAYPGIRESRRITCEYTLSLKDFQARASFPDEIGRYCYPVDIHEKTTDPAEHQKFLKEYEELYRYHKGESYGIPYRCLIPKGLSNVLTAGRCIGTDRYMQASIRVMPGCFITGQAVGTAAVLTASQDDVRNINVDMLQQTLLKQGALLPNYHL